MKGCHVLSLRVEADLDNIWDNLAKRWEKQAKTYAREFWQSIGYAANASGGSQECLDVSYGFLATTLPFSQT